MRQTASHFVLILMLLPFGTADARQYERLQVDRDQVRSWNLFTERLYELHQRMISNRSIDKKVSMGGYRDNENFYRQVEYLDRASGRLLSRIQWETARPELIHMIEVFVYDESGGLRLDYLSAYLPLARNAPIQTLINVHYRDRQLAAYRQFDASGQRIYEQCKGDFFGRPLFISLDEDDIPFGEPDFDDPLRNEAYLSCFGDLQTDAGQLLNPLQALSSIDRPAALAVNADQDAYSALLQRIDENPQDVGALTRLGVHHFEQHEFDTAIEYLSRALAVDSADDEALFWRGMAYGRNRQHRQGIEDLTVYISRHPHESRAFTKRGVRYIWAGDLVRARQDLQQAIRLDDSNAEAHDDLGVIYAQQKDYRRAISHFRQALRHDPAYFKAWHNLAMVHYLLKQHAAALEYADKSLALKRSRDTLLLKSLVLDAMGLHAEAERHRSGADNVAAGNWSETFPVK